MARARRHLHSGHVAAALQDACDHGRFMALDMRKICVHRCRATESGRMVESKRIPTAEKHHGRRIPDEQLVGCGVVDAKAFQGPLQAPASGRFGPVTCDYRGMPNLDDGARFNAIPARLSPGHCAIEWRSVYLPNFQMVAPIRGSTRQRGAQLRTHIVVFDEVQTGDDAIFRKCDQPVSRSVSDKFGEFLSGGSPSRCQPCCREVQQRRVFALHDQPGTHVCRSGSSLNEV